MSTRQWIGAVVLAACFGFMFGAAFINHLN